MQQSVFYILAGVLFGMANVIPGVSGGTMAVVFGVYERLIGILSDPIHRIKKDLPFIVFFFLGTAAGILAFGKLMNALLESSLRSETFMFFIGVIIGSLPLIFRKAFLRGKTVRISAGSAVAFFIGFGIMIPMIAAGNNDAAKEAAKANAALGNAAFGQAVLMLFYGVIASSTMIIPGISGSFVMLLLGIYPTLMASVSALSAFGSQATTAIILLLPFGAGVILGLVFCSRLIKYLLKRYSAATYSAILGFVLGSIGCVIREVTRITISGILALIFGIVVLWAFERFSPEK